MGVCPGGRTGHRDFHSLCWDQSTVPGAAGTTSHMAAGPQEPAVVSDTADAAGAQSCRTQKERNPPLLSREPAGLGGLPQGSKNRRGLSQVWTPDTKGLSGLERGSGMWGRGLAPHPTPETGSRCGGWCTGNSSSPALSRGVRPDLQPGLFLCCEDFHRGRFQARSRKLGREVPAAGSHKPVQCCTPATRKHAPPPGSTWGRGERDLALRGAWAPGTETQAAANSVRAWLSVETEEPSFPGASRWGSSIRLW